MIGYIYYLWSKDENDVFYIGATVKPKKRLKAHRNAPKEYYLDESGDYFPRKIHISINMSIIEEVFFENKRELFDIEDYWIHQFIAWGFPLKNVRYKGYSPIEHRRNQLKEIGLDLINGKIIGL